jgi:hypothetical protein
MSIYKDKVKCCNCNFIGELDTKTINQIIKANVFEVGSIPKDFEENDCMPDCGINR